MTFRYVIVACAASSGIGAWIGWHARATKEMLDRRDTRSWDRRQEALHVMDVVSQRTRNDPPDWHGELRRSRGE